MYMYMWLSQSSHQPQEVLLAQFSLYVHKGGLKPDSFHLFHFVHVADDVLYDFLKLTKVKTERRSYRNE